MAVLVDTVRASGKDQATVRISIPANVRCSLPKWYSCERSVLIQVGTIEGKGEEAAAVRISIAPNPSHLEFVGPVVLGMVRAEQTRLQDHGRKRVMGLLIHGDAAFAGLGVVAECLQLADVPGETSLSHIS